MIRIMGKNMAFFLAGIFYLFMSILPAFAVEKELITKQLKSTIKDAQAEVEQIRSSVSKCKDTRCLDGLKGKLDTIRGQIDRINNLLSSLEECRKKIEELYSKANAKLKNKKAEVGRLRLQLIRAKRRLARMQQVGPLAEAWDTYKNNKTKENFIRLFELAMGRKPNRSELAQYDIQAMIIYRNILAKGVTGIAMGLVEVGKLCMSLVDVLTGEALKDPVQGVVDMAKEMAVDNLIEATGLSEVFGASSIVKTIAGIGGAGTAVSELEDVVSSMAEESYNKAKAALHGIKEGADLSQEIKKAEQANEKIALLISEKEKQLSKALKAVEALKSGLDKIGKEIEGYRKKRDEISDALLLILDDIRLKKNNMELLACKRENKRSSVLMQKAKKTKYYPAGLRFSIQEPNDYDLRYDKYITMSADDLTRCSLRGRPPRYLPFQLSAEEWGFKWFEEERIILSREKIIRYRSGPAVDYEYISLPDRTKKIRFQRRVDSLSFPYYPKAKISLHGDTTAVKVDKEKRLIVAQSPGHVVLVASIQGVQKINRVLADRYIFKKIILYYDYGKTSPYKRETRQQDIVTDYSYEPIIGELRSTDKEIRVLKVTGVRYEGFDRPELETGEIDIFKEHQKKREISAKVKLTDGRGELYRDAYNLCVWINGRTAIYDGVEWTGDLQEGMLSLGLVDSKGKLYYKKDFKVTGNNVDLEITPSVESPLNTASLYHLPVGKELRIALVVDGNADMKKYEVRWNGTSASGFSFKKTTGFIKSGGKWISENVIKVGQDMLDKMLKGKLPDDGGINVINSIELVRKADGKVFFRGGNINIQPMFPRVTGMEIVDMDFKKPLMSADFFWPASPVPRARQIKTGLELSFGKRKEVVTYSLLRMAHKRHCFPYSLSLFTTASSSFSINPMTGLLEWREAGTAHSSPPRVGNFVMYASLEPDFNMLLQDMDPLRDSLFLRANRAELSLNMDIANNRREFLLKVNGPAKMGGYRAKWYFLGGRVANTGFKGKLSHLQVVDQLYSPSRFWKVEIINHLGERKAICKKSFLKEADTNPRISLNVPSHVEPGDKVEITAYVNNIPPGLMKECRCKWSTDSDEAVFFNDKTIIYPLMSEKISRKDIGVCRGILVIKKKKGKYNRDVKLINVKVDLIRVGK